MYGHGRGIQGGGGVRPTGFVWPPPATTPRPLLPQYQDALMGNRPAPPAPQVVFAPAPVQVTTRGFRVPSPTLSPTRAATTRQPAATRHSRPPRLHLLQPWQGGGAEALRLRDRAGATVRCRGRHPGREGFCYGGCLRRGCGASLGEGLGSPCSPGRRYRGEEGDDLLQPLPHRRRQQQPLPLRCELAGPSSLASYICCMFRSGSLV
jgi:hypothetical protein